MAQHISIQNSANKNIQKIYRSICGKFKKGIFVVRSSLKYQEIYEENFKESENDIVFQTWRTINKDKEIFEIHYEELKKINPDTQKDGALKQMRDVWALPLVQGKDCTGKTEGQYIQHKNLREC